MGALRLPILGSIIPVLPQRHSRSPKIVFQVQTRSAGLGLFWNLIGARFIIGQVNRKVRSILAEKSAVKNFGPDWDSLVTGSLDVFIKSVEASPSFLSADAGYGYSLIPSTMLIT